MLIFTSGSYKIINRSVNTSKAKIKSVYAGYFNKKHRKSKKLYSKKSKLIQRKSFMRPEPSKLEKESKNTLVRTLTIDKPKLYNPVLRSQCSMTSRDIEFSNCKSLKKMTTFKTSSSGNQHSKTSNLKVDQLSVTERERTSSFMNKLPQMVKISEEYALSLLTTNIE